MSGIIEPTTTAGLEIVDPGEPVRLDKVGIEPEAVDDQVFGGPSNRVG
jgi:hypothetical protein